MKRALVIGVLIVGLLGMTLPATSGAAGNKPRVLCWNNDFPEPVGSGQADTRVEPRKCNFFKRGESSYSGALRAIGLDWKSWGDRNAIGRGTNIAGMGAEAPVTVRLSKVSRNCVGKSIFTKATFLFDGRSSDFKMWSCPNQRARYRDMPGTDGGPAERGCEPVLNATVYVGATNMGCSNARVVAKRAVRGNAQHRKWRCTGVGSNFGHCHGRGPRAGKIVHWAVND